MKRILFSFVLFVSLWSVVLFRHKDDVLETRKQTAESTNHVWLQTNTVTRWALWTNDFVATNHMVVTINRIPHPRARYEVLYETNTLVMIRTGHGDTWVEYDTNKLLDPDISLGEMTDHGNKMLYAIMMIYGVQKATFNRYTISVYRTLGVSWDEIMPKVVAEITRPR